MAVLNTLSQLVLGESPRLDDVALNVSELSLILSCLLLGMAPLPILLFVFETFWERSISSFLNHFKND